MTIELTHFFVSFWMMTVIWFVQIVHYPLFLYVPKIARVQYSQKHQQWISIIVMPAMLIELVTLLLLGNSLSYNMYWIIMLVSMIIIWSSTFFVQVPCHNQLLIDPQDIFIKRLVNSNWVRTIFWTLKTIIAGLLIFGVVQ